MNQIEELKTKIQKLVNQYNFGNYKLVIQEVISSPEVSGANAFLQKHSSDMGLWIITGTPTLEIQTIIKARNMTHYFKGLYGSPESKTQWANHILDVHDLSPNETVFIGDAIQDQKAAENTGISFILRETPDNQKYFSEYAGTRLNDLTELEELLLTL